MILFYSFNLNRNTQSVELFQFLRFLSLPFSAFSTSFASFLHIELTNVHAMQPMYFGTLRRNSKYVLNSKCIVQCSSGELPYAAVLCVCSSVLCSNEHANGSPFAAIGQCTITYTVTSRMNTMYTV